ncbi:MAG: hypothetical protein LLG01_16690 [Planctomycetaceae bacterium]|nr:hypothetical protein [Planctomycetaceae bacterium]
MRYMLLVIALAAAGCQGNRPAPAAPATQAASEPAWPKSGQAAEGIRLTIRSQKEVLELGQPIVLETRLENTGDELKVVVFDSSRISYPGSGLSLEMTDSKGTLYSYGGPQLAVAMQPRSAFFNIDRKSSRTGRMELHPAWFNPELAAGQYSLALRLESLTREYFQRFRQNRMTSTREDELNDLPAGGSVLSSPVLSNTIKITIAPKPAGTVVNGLELGIAAAQDVYREGEPITVQAEFRNVLGKAMMFRLGVCQCGCFGGFTIRDKGGRTLLPIGAQHARACDPWRDTSHIELEPGQVFRTTLEVPREGLYYQDAPYSGEPITLKAGLHDVVFKYHIAPDAKANVWSGEIDSNSLRITVAGGK